MSMSCACVACQIARAFRVGMHWACAAICCSDYFRGVLCVCALCAYLTEGPSCDYDVGKIGK
jgi:hypothetical protein